MKKKVALFEQEKIIITKKKKKKTINKDELYSVGMCCIHTWTSLRSIIGVFAAA